MSECSMNQQFENLDTILELLIQYCKTNLTNGWEVASMIDTLDDINLIKPTKPPTSATCYELDIIRYEYKLEEFERNKRTLKTTRGSRF